MKYAWISYQAIFTVFISSYCNSLSALKCGIFKAFFNAFSNNVTAKSAPFARGIRLKELFKWCAPDQLYMQQCLLQFSNELRLRQYDRRRRTRAWALQTWVTIFTVSTRQSTLIMQDHDTALDRSQGTTLLMCRRHCHLLVNRAHHVVNHWKPTDCIQKMHIWPM